MCRSSVPVQIPDNQPGGSIAWCKAICQDRGNLYAGIQAVHYCFCSDTFGGYGPALPESAKLHATSCIERHTVVKYIHVHVHVHLYMSVHLYMDFFEKANMYKCFFSIFIYCLIHIHVLLMHTFSKMLVSSSV